MAANPNKDLFQEAKFVFRGTVRQTKSANVAQIKNTARTIVVAVDEVFKAPEILGNFAGQTITVKLGDEENVKKGEEAIFYTNGWIFGETIAVESLGHSRVEANTKNLAAARVNPFKSLKDDIIKNRLETADAVVIGRVTSVRLPEENFASSKVRSMVKSETGKRRPISEHDPQWREAVVEVSNADKGGSGENQIVVRFPASDDVRWYRAPKFAAGQEGVFILHKTEPASITAARRVAATVTHDEAETTEATYTALHPEDFQPLRNSPEIKTLIKNIK